MEDEYGIHFAKAIEALVSGNAVLEGRLVSAAGALVTIQIARLPKDLRADFTEVWRRLTEVESEDEGSFNASVQKMTPQMRSETASMILDLYTRYIKHFPE